MYEDRLMRRQEASHIDHSLDHESRYVQICIILSVGCVLSTLVVGLRSYTRLAILRTFGIDDALMMGAQALSIGAATAIGLEGHYGLGQHTWVQPEEHFIPYMKSFYSSIVTYNVSMCLVKISLLLQYRRIFAVQTMQRLTLIGTMFMTAWAFTLCFLLTLTCVPVAKFWDHTIPGRCLNSLHIWYVMAAVNLATDFSVFLLPIPVIRSLQLPKRQKVLLFAVFGLGLFTCIISIIRIRTLRVAAETQDPNWDNTDAAIWSFIEVTIGVLAACLPTLRPIFKTIMPRVFGSSFSHGNSRSGYGPSLRHSSYGTKGGNLSSNYKKSPIGRSESMWSLRDEDRIELAAKEANKMMAVPVGAYKINISAGGRGGSGGDGRDGGDGDGDLEGSRRSPDNHNWDDGDELGLVKGVIVTKTVVTQKTSLSS